ncbi:MAG: hypothetical protein AAGC55_03000, partial [Myxococcota bacterium]
MNRYRDTSSEPPGPSGLIGLRQYLSFERQPLDYMLTLARDHGDIVRSSMFGKAFYLVSHPDHIETIFVHRHRQVIKDRYTRDLSAALG